MEKSSFRDLTEELEYLSLIDFPEYTEEFLQYIRNLESWINTSDMPEDFDGISNEVEYDKVNLDIPSLETNTKEALTFFAN